LKKGFETAYSGGIGFERLKCGIEEKKWRRVRELAEKIRQPFWSGKD